MEQLLNSSNGIIILTKYLFFFYSMIVEFRIPLPIEVNDFEVAQLYMVAKLQENVTGGGEGVIVLKNEPYLIMNWFLMIGMIMQMVIWVNLN